MTCGLFGINAVACNDTDVTLQAPSGFSHYYWYDSSNFSVRIDTGGTIHIPRPAVPTTYAVIIVPFTGFGCPDTLYSHVIPTDLQVHKMNDTTICLGSSINLTSNASDIALPLTYAWSPSGTLSCNTCATPLLTPTAFGSTYYTFTVTDVVGCKKMDSIKVTTVGVKLHADSTDATCHGFTDGSASVTPTAGVPPFTYTWTTFPVQTTSAATGLGAGTYTVTVTDNMGCSAKAKVSVNDSPALVIGIGSTHGPTTCGGNDGYIRIGGAQVKPSTPYMIKYRYNGVWYTLLTVTTSADTIIMNNLFQGTYDSITIIKPGCQFNYAGPAILRDPALPAPPVLSSNSPVCLNGTIVVTATDITPGVRYSWTGPGLFSAAGSTASRPFATYADSGMYIVTVDTVNCKRTDSIMVRVIPNPFPMADNNGPLCSGDTLKLTSSSANGATSFVWFGPAAYTSRNQNPVLGNVQTPSLGTYTVVITLNGCSATATTNVAIIETPSAPIVRDTLYCQFNSNAVPLTNLVGSTANLLWYTSPTGGLGSAVPVPGLNTNVAGTTSWYVSQSTAAPKCESPRSKVSVTVYEQPNPALSITDTIVCRGDQVLLSAKPIGQANTGITWNFGNGDSMRNVNPIMHSFDAVGSYTVSVNAYYLACPQITISKPIRVFAYPDIYLGADTAICPGGQALILTDNINADVASAKWEWNTGDVGPQLIVHKPGTYYTVVTINGCSSTDTVIVRNDCYLDIPNVFTPNGDGLNDYFFPRQFLSKGLISFKMNIYNRWGEMIYETLATDGRGWDGTYNGVPQPEGTFIYVMDAVFKDGQHEHHQGNVTLIR
jgi:gliding motility-associated-like protein